MVRTRAQRVVNEEHGIAQSPQQVLATPKRSRKTAKKNTNAVVRNATRSNNQDAKESESDVSTKSAKATKSKKTASKTGAKKSRLRDAAAKAKPKVTQDIVLLDENSPIITLPFEIQETSDQDSEGQENNLMSNGVTRSTRASSRETSKEPGKAPKSGRATTRAVSKQKQKEDITTQSIEAAPVSTSLAGLFNHLSSSLMGKESTQSEEAEPEEAPTEEKEVSPDTTKKTKTMRAKTKSHRVLQERGTIKRKTTTSTISSAIGKRKRVEPEQEDEDDDEPESPLEIPELKKKTATWSFKPNDEGRLSLLARENVDPDDVTVIFLEKEEAQQFIAQEFERKKQVRFADRIAKQHPDLTEEERAAHQAKYQAQNLQLTTKGFFDNDLPRGGDMRALARKIDGGKKSMLELVEGLTELDDQELREELANDLIELAMALRAAGPQSKPMSPIEKTAVASLEPSNKEDNASSQKVVEKQATPPAVPASTPGRLYASIRKLGSFLPFGYTTPIPAPTDDQAGVEEHLQSPDSPTPAPRTEKQSSRLIKGTSKQQSGNAVTESSQQARLSSSLNASKTFDEFPISTPTKRKADQISTGTTSKTSQQVEIPSTPAPAKSSNVFSMTAPIGRSYKTPLTNAQRVAAGFKPKEKVTQMPPARSIATPKTPGTVKRTIGSVYYPLTVDGKIPRPSENSYGINEAYFYDASSSSESEQENQEFRVPKRARHRYMEKQKEKKEREEKAAEEAKKQAQEGEKRKSPCIGFDDFDPKRIANWGNWSKTPDARVISAPDLSDSSSGEETTTETEEEKRKAEEAKTKKTQEIKDTGEASKAKLPNIPKTPSRLKEVMTASPPQIDIKERVRQHFDPRVAHGAFNWAAQI